jgi:uncharacterized protein YheU (UPF0270 family)
VNLFTNQPLTASAGHPENPYALSPSTSLRYSQPRLSAPSIIEVPHTALPKETLRALIEEFVTRAGTDYGSVEKTLEQKMADVHRQLVRGQAKIVFDPATETTNIVVADMI